MARKQKIDDEDIIALTNLLCTMVSALVDEPDHVSITIKRGATDLVLELDTSESDIPFVLGHHQANYERITGLMHSAARARGVSVAVRYAPAR